MKHIVFFILWIVQSIGYAVWYCDFKKSGSQENMVMKGTVVLIR